MATTPTQPVDPDASDPGAPGSEAGPHIPEVREPFDALLLLALVCGAGVIALVAAYVGMTGNAPAALQAWATSEVNLSGRSDPDPVRRRGTRRPAGRPAGDGRRARRPRGPGIGGRQSPGRRRRQQRHQRSPPGGGGGRLPVGSAGRLRRRGPRATSHDRRTAPGHRRPATTHDRPATTDHRPATTHDRPATTDHRPATTHDRPATTDHRPATTHDRPATTDHRPATTDHRPATTHDRPATTDHRAGDALTGGHARPEGAAARHRLSGTQHLPPVPLSGNPPDRTSADEGPADECPGQPLDQQGVPSMARSDPGRRG